MVKTGIPIIDSVIETFPWDKSEEYEKLQERYGPEVEDVLAELILLPLLNFDSVNDMADATGRNKNDYYDLLKDHKIDWMRLLQEFTWHFFLAALQVFQHSKSESFRSRWRLHILVDDTLLRRWSNKMYGSFHLWNYVDKHWMSGQKLVVLAVTVGKDKFSFPLLCAISDATCFAVRRTTTEKVIEALNSLHQAAVDEGLSFAGVRLVGDSGYTSDDIATTAKKLGLQYFGAAKAAWNFTLADGTTIKCGDLQHGAIPEKVRHSSRMDRRYYRLIVTHATLGRVALCIFSCHKKAVGKKIRFWVYLSTDTSANCITIFRTHKVRWKIEQMFRTFKHGLGLRFYQGIGKIGQQAWFALTCLRLILVRLAIKLGYRHPSLRWHIPRRNWGLSRCFRFIGNHYCLDLNYFGKKRLHYALNMKSF